MAKTDDAKKLPELVAGMVNGDKQAMESFFELVDVLEDKKLKKEGRHALMMVVIGKIFSSSSAGEATRPRIPCADLTSLASGRVRAVRAGQSYP